MNNIQRRFLSHLVTRLGLGDFFSALSKRPADFQPQEENLLAVGVPKRWCGRTGDVLTIAFSQPTRLNTVALREHSSHVVRFALQKPTQDGKGWESFYESDKIERFRLCTFPTQTLSNFRFVVLDAVGCVTLEEVAAYLIQPVEREKPFHVSAYLRLDSDHYLEMQDEQKRAYASYFHTITDVMLFDSLQWTGKGEIAFKDGEQLITWSMGKEKWLRKADVIRKIVAMSGEHVRLLPSFLAFPPEAIAIMEQQPETVVRNLLSMVEECGFDGIDLDWEFPKGKAQWDMFSRFLVILKQALAPKAYTLSVALPDWGVGLTPDAVRSIDVLSYMTYDAVDLNGYQSPFGRSAVRAVEYARKCGFQPGQINLGLPYYGRPTYNAPYWLEWNQAKLGYWDNYDPELTHEGIVMDAYYNSPGMIADKTAYAMALGLRGVMIFPLYLDYPTGHPLCLTDAIQRTVDERLALPEDRKQ